MDDAGCEHELAAMLRRAAALTAAGIPLTEALANAARDDRQTGSLAPSARLSDRLAMGNQVPEALRAFADESLLPDAHIVADVVEVHLRMGGNAPALCARLADAVHARARLRRDARAATAPARASLRLVIVLPLVVLGGIVVARPDALAALPAAVLIVAAGPALVLLAAAGLVLRRMHRRLADELAGRSASCARQAGAGDARRAAVAAACVTLLAGVASPAVVLPGLIGVFALLAAPFLSERARRRRESAQLRLRLAGMCDVTRSVLAAGGSPSEAIQLALRHDAEWIATELGAVPGGEVSADDLARFQQSALAARQPELRDFLLALELAARYGRSADPALDTVVRDAASAQREHLRTVAAAAGPRIQLVTVLLVVPAITWVVLAITAWAFLRQLGALGLA